MMWVTKKTLHTLGVFAPCDDLQHWVTKHKKFRSVKSLTVSELLVKKKKIKMLEDAHFLLFSFKEN